ncbi:site-2 protease family protein [Peptostreptococcaceae bacterium OttesenSCG-928-C18]|nr:site-2 protease family protein [Peptostreptococcaceae bacterium OttesenSCG-928-C18]
MNISRLEIINKLAMAIALLFSLIMHENAHGLMAYLMGDSTAKDAGRISLNPLKHLSLYGTLSLFIFKFGWAKPVPVNPYNYRKKRLGNFLVSIAGISTNLIMALISVLIYYGLSNLGIKSFFLAFFMEYLITYNVFLAIFNLIPIPPLDGSKIIYTFLPDNLVYKLSKNEQYFNILLIILIVTGVVGNIVHFFSNYVIDFFNFILRVI